MVIVAYAELHHIPRQQLEFALHRTPLAVDLLIRVGVFQLHIARRSTQNQVSVLIQCGGSGSLGGDANCVRIGPRSHLEVVLQLLRIAVIDEVNTGICAGDPGVGKVRHVGVPLRRVVADEVVADAGLRLKSFHGGFLVCSQQTQVELRGPGCAGCALRRERGWNISRRGRVGTAQGKGDLAGGKPQRVVRPMRYEAEPGRSLAAVCFELKRERTSLDRRGSRLPGQLRRRVMHRVGWIQRCGGRCDGTCAAQSGSGGRWCNSRACGAQGKAESNEHNKPDRSNEEAELPHRSLHQLFVRGPGLPCRP